MPARPAGHPVPRETPQRCSVRADQRLDPMLGTAFPADRVLLVEQPGPWGRQGLTQSRFAPEVAARVVARASAAGVRVLCIRRPGRSATEHRAWAFVDCRPGQERMVWGHFEADADALDLPLELPAVLPPVEPLYLVCAHGSHDACCAIRGRPVAAALAAVRPDQVWECSHVGGDRFAANVLVLPSGLLYGGLDPVEAAPLVALTERGEALSGALRGKVGLRPEAQAALALAYRRWGGVTAAIRVVGLHRQESGRTTVLLSRGEAEAAVVVETRRGDVHRLTCQMTTPATVLTYHPVSFRVR